MTELRCGGGGAVQAVQGFRIWTDQRVGLRIHEKDLLDLQGLPPFRTFEFNCLEL